MGRHRPRERFHPPSVRRQFVTIGALAVITALAAGVFLTMKPHHTATVLTSKCKPGGCHHIAPTPLRPVTMIPVPMPASSPATSRPADPGTDPGANRTAATTAPARGRVSATPAPRPSRTATPAPTATSPAPTPGALISIRATTACCTTFYIQHDDSDNRVVITQITQGSSATAKADATWLVQAGLADSSCVSLESVNDPGQYLRHYDFELYLDPDDGSAQFAEDATFCPRRPGNSGQGYSFESVNYPDKYIRHYDYVVYIASDGGSNPWDNPNLWSDDTTWLVTQPWA